MLVTQSGILVAVIWGSKVRVHDFGKVKVQLKVSARQGQVKHSWLNKKRRVLVPKLRAKGGARVAS